jgi:hypothetical protein
VGVLFPLALHRTAEGLAGARQTGHDGSDGNAQHSGQFLVGKALQLAKHEQFTRTKGQAPHSLFDQADIFGLKR